MSAAAKRFRDLERRFRKIAPSRRLSPAQRHDLMWAAALQQVVEIATAELCLGIPHDRRLILQMKLEIGARLASVGIKTSSPPGA